MKAIARRLVAKRPLRNCPFVVSSSLLTTKVFHNYNHHFLAIQAGGTAITLAQRNWTDGLRYTSNREKSLEAYKPIRKKKAPRLSPKLKKWVVKKIVARERQEEETQTKQRERLCTGCGVAVKTTSAGERGSSRNRSTKNLVLARTARGNKNDIGRRPERFVDVADPENDDGNTFLCQRCHDLNSGNIYKAYDALRDVDPSVFVKQLRYIVGRRAWGVCVAVVDATDPEHSAPKVLRKAVGKTPTILVLTKIDLLPRYDNFIEGRIKQQILRILGGNKNSFFATFGVSAKSGEGLPKLADYLALKHQGRDIFVVGTANVGKSTLVQRLTPSIVAASHRKRQKEDEAEGRLERVQKSLRVTASHLPGTTLQAVRIPCFASSEHALWDTPGLINAKAVQYNLFPSHLMEPLTQPQPIREGFSGFVAEGESILVEATWLEGFVLARMDILHANKVFARTFLHGSLRISVVPTEEAPSRATIPTWYAEQVFGDTAGGRKDYSRTLAAYTTDKNPQGIFRPREDFRSAKGGFIFDVVFPSLGWINLSTPQNALTEDCVFVPHVVDGSIFSMRPALYWRS